MFLMWVDFFVLPSRLVWEWGLLPAWYSSSCLSSSSRPVAPPPAGSPRLCFYCTAQTVRPGPVWKHNTPYSPCVWLHIKRSLVWNQMLSEPVFEFFLSVFISNVALTMWLHPVPWVKPLSSSWCSLKDNSAIFKPGFFLLVCFCFYQNRLEFKAYWDIFVACS